MENLKDFVPRGNRMPDFDPNDYVRGINSPIEYVVRNASGDWSEDFSPYQPQKFKFDTNSCWCISGVNIVEDQLDFLMRRGSLPEASIKWFKDNGYIDDQNCFKLSWRFIYALSGAYENGNSQWNFWQLLDEYGIPPALDFDFTMADSIPYATQYLMCNAAGDKTKITKEIKAKAKEFKKYIDIQYEWVGKVWYTPEDNLLRSALKQSPLQIGIPACMDTYNSGTVIDCGRKAADHAVELYKIGEDGTRYIFDQYEPHLKTLSATYPLLMVVNGVISPIIAQADIPNVPLYESNAITRLWESIWAWFVKWYT